MANNKIQLSNGVVLLDLTGDTVAAPYMATGYTAHDKSGQTVTGTAALVYNAADESLTMPGWVVEVQ